MNAKISSSVKLLSGAVCVFMVLSISLLSSSSINANTLSHQPSTINQMKMLVTPQDQTVTQALQEALATPDTSVSEAPSSTIADINKMRLWVFSNIKQDSDQALHGVSDYWQTPTETLSLKAGDCEDFAILMVSMMRAYGAPKDQVYVAVGNVNGDWHAFVVERYSYGAWVEFDPENVDDAVLLGGNMPLPYDISYCFNDQGGFNGKPVYPTHYNIPPVSIVPVIPPATSEGPRTITLINQTGQVSFGWSIANPSDVYDYIFLRRDHEAIIVAEVDKSNQTIIRTWTLNITDNIKQQIIDVAKTDDLSQAMINKGAQFISFEPVFNFIRSTTPQYLDGVPFYEYHVEFSAFVNIVLDGRYYLEWVGIGDQHLTNWPATTHSLPEQVLNNEYVIPF